MQFQNVLVVLATAFVIGTNALNMYVELFYCRYIRTAPMLDDHITKT